MTENVFRFTGDAVVHNPWPILVQDEIIDPELYGDLARALPEPREFGRGFRMHGDLTSGDGRYEQLLAESSAWRRLHHTVYSETFVREVLEVFRSDLERSHADGELIDPLEEIRYFDLVGEGGSMRSEMQTIPSHRSVMDVYARLDVGFGVVGYGRDSGGKGVHTDNRSRLVSGLVYFSDQNDLEGGEFEVHALTGWKTAL